MFCILRIVSVRKLSCKPSLSSACHCSNPHPPKKITGINGKNSPFFFFWMQQQWSLLFLVHVRSQQVDDITTQGARQTGLSESTLRMTIPACGGLILILLRISFIMSLYQPLPFSVNPNEKCNDKFNLNAQLPWLLVIGNILCVTLFLAAILQNRFLSRTGTERLDMACRYISYVYNWI